MTTLFHITTEARVNGILEEGLQPCSRGARLKLDEHIRVLEDTEGIDGKDKLIKQLKTDCPFSWDTDFCDYVGHLIFKELQEEGKIAHNMALDGFLKYFYSLFANNQDHPDYQKMRANKLEWMDRAGKHPFRGQGFICGLLEAFPALWVESGELNRLLNKIGAKDYGHDTKEFYLALLSWKTTPEQEENIIVADYGFNSMLLRGTEREKMAVTISETAPPEFEWMAGNMTRDLTPAGLLETLKYFTTMKTLKEHLTNPEGRLLEVFSPYATQIDSENVQLFTVKREDLTPFHEKRPELRFKTYSK